MRDGFDLGWVEVQGMARYLGHGSEAGVGGIP